MSFGSVINGRLKRTKSNPKVDRLKGWVSIAGCGANGGALIGDRFLEEAGLMGAWIGPVSYDFGVERGPAQARSLEEHFEVREPIGVDGLSELLKLFF